MAGPEILIPIVAIGGGIMVALRGMKLKHAQIMARSGAHTDQFQGVIGEMHNEITRLKDRVAVLEKLVTDDDRKLADEISRLRSSETNPRA